MKLRIAKKILDRRHRVRGLNYRGSTVARARHRCRHELRWWTRLPHRPTGIEQAFWAVSDAATRAAAALKSIRTKGVT